jgi:FimV-like protein
MRLMLFYLFLFVNIFVMAAEYSAKDEVFLKNAVRTMQQQQQTIHDLQLSLSKLKSEQVNLKKKLSNIDASNFYSSSVETVQETWPSVSQWWVLSLAVIILWFMLELGDSVPIQKSKTSSINENKDNGFEKLDEYDFLNTTEGMDSQLDLARAYIEMGDMFAARETVDLVLSSGNIEQMKQAEILLADIRSQESR